MDIFTACSLQLTRDPLHAICLEQPSVWMIVHCFLPLQPCVPPALNHFGKITNTPHPACVEAPGLSP